MRYIRSRPWRSRGPWFGNRAGARRRGYRDDEVLSVAHGVFQDGDDVVVAAESEAMTARDVVLPEPDDRPIPESTIAARVDLSGSRAIPSPETEPMLDAPEAAIVALDWRTRTGQSDGDSPVSRHSA